MVLAIMRHDTSTKTNARRERKGETILLWMKCMGLEVNQIFGYFNMIFWFIQKLKKFVFRRWQFSRTLIATRMDRALMLIAWIKPLFFMWFLNNFIIQQLIQVTHKTEEEKMRENRKELKICGTMRWDDLSFTSQPKFAVIIVCYEHFGPKHSNAKPM